MRSGYLGFALWAVSQLAAGQSTAITVRLYNYAGAAGVLEKAAPEAQRVLARAGVETRWVECPLRGQVEPRHQACMAPMRRADAFLIIIPPSMEAPANLGHILGYARVNPKEPSNRIYVRYELVRRTALAHGQVSESRLLGYVMAHEVAHLILGAKRHARRGVMKESWSEKDLFEISRGTLNFSDEEIRQLRAIVAAHVQNPDL